jgi:hypothetical protein
MIRQSVQCFTYHQIEMVKGRRRSVHVSSCKWLELQAKAQKGRVGDEPISSKSTMNGMCPVLRDGQQHRWNVTGVKPAYAFLRFSRKYAGWTQQKWYEQPADDVKIVPNVDLEGSRRGAREYRTVEMLAPRDSRFQGC